MRDSQQLSLLPAVTLFLPTLQARSAGRGAGRALDQTPGSDSLTSSSTVLPDACSRRASALLLKAQGLDLCSVFSQI